MIKLCDGGVLELTDESQFKLEEYANLLIKWNGLNLIAKSTQADIFGWHIRDALSVFNIVQFFVQEHEDIAIVDFGAGGGILGMSLSCVGIKNITLVERCTTKADFLREILKFESVRSDCTGLSNVCLLARGVSSIAKTLHAANIIKTDDAIVHAIFFKADDSYREIQEARKYWNFKSRTCSRKARAWGRVIVLENITVKTTQNKNR